jgi:predicted Fe-Mo cluster-binding NifX family protein
LINETYNDQYQLFFRQAYALHKRRLEQGDIFNTGGKRMKIAVTSNGSTLDDQVEARFGRSPYFIFANPDTLEFESMPNPNMSLGGGAGPQSAQLMAEKGVSVVLTGNCGPNAFQTFGAAGIQVITGVSGRVREAVEKFKFGQLAQSAAPTVQSHFGMGRGMGGGKGLGSGRGMCGRRGMGGGAGGGSRWFTGTEDMESASSDTSQTSALSEKKEIETLKQTSRELRRQLEAIEGRLNVLSAKKTGILA